MEHLNTSPNLNNGIQSFSVVQCHSIRDNVRCYLDQGYSPIPVHYQTKIPSVSDWTRPGLINASNVDQ
jgi:hypothetical protein